MLGSILTAVALAGVALLVLVVWIRKGPQGRARYRRRYRGRRAHNIIETTDELGRRGPSGDIHGVGGYGDS